MNIFGRSLRTFSVSIIIFGTASILFSQDKASGKICLWEVQGKQNKVFLMGSVHVMEKADYPLDARILNAFDQSPNIVFEINQDSAQTPAFQKYTLSQAMFSNGQTFKSVVGDSIYQMVQAVFLKSNMNLAQLNGFKPWFVDVTMTMVMLQQLGFDPNYGIDPFMFRRAKTKNKNVLSFETPKEQIDLLASLDFGDQKAMILQTLEESGDIRQYFGKIMGYWKNGQIDSLGQFLSKGFADYPAIAQKLLTNRNLKWINDLEKFLNDKQNYLVVVGAGHMAGKHGLIALLREKRYKVTQQ